MDMLAFQTVVVVKPFSVDQSRTTASVCRDDLLTAFGADFLAKFCQFGSGRLSEMMSLDVISIVDSSIRLFVRQSI